ncbi:MAG: ferritin family protein [archaeon]
METSKKDILKFLESAKQFELDLMNLYEDQAERANGEAKELLLKISRDEKIHAAIVQRIIEKVEARK